MLLPTKGPVHVEKGVGASYAIFQSLVIRL